MKRYGILIFTFVVVLSIILAGSYALAGDRIGFIDLRKIMIQSKAGKTASLEFRKAVEKDKAVIQERETELKRLKEELEKQRLILTPDAVTTKELDYQRKFRDYQRMVKDSKEELELKDQELSRRLIPEILKVVNDIGGKEGYTMILDVSTQGLAYHSRKNDITDKVVKKFDKSYEVKK
jgi:outer membrane protein